MSNPAYTRLFLDGPNMLPDNSILAFTSITAVENFFGLHTKEATMAQEYFTGPYASQATMLFTRIGLGQRPHLIGSDLDVAALVGLSGSLSLTFDGFNYAGHVDLTGVSTIADVALAVRKALHHLPAVGTLTGSWIEERTIHFEGTLTNNVDVTEASGQPPLVVGGLISGAGIVDNNHSTQIIYHHNGYYTTGAGSGNAPTMEAMTETYGILHVGAQASGEIEPGLRLTGAGVSDLTAVISLLSGNGGAGSEWIVNNGQAIAPETMETTAPSLTVDGTHIVGATGARDFLEIQPGIEYGFDQNPSAISFADPSHMANALGLSQIAGAYDASPGGQHVSINTFMSEVMSENSSWSSFQSIEPRLATEFETWAAANLGHTFLTNIFTTLPAGETGTSVDREQHSLTSMIACVGRNLWT